MVTIVGIILLLSAVAKLRDRTMFEAALRAYRYRLLRDQRTLAFVALVVVGSELATASCLFCRVLLPWSAIAALALLAVFSVVTAMSLLSGRARHRCGCMVLGRDEVIGWHICLRNTALACLLVPSVVGRWAVLFLFCAMILLIAAFLTSRIEHQAVSR